MLSKANKTISPAALGRVKPVFREGAGETYQPVPHHKIATAVLRALRAAGWKLTESNFHLARGGSDLLAGFRTETGYALGLAASTTQRRTLTAFAGSMTAEGVTVMASLPCAPYNKDFDAKKEAATVVEWFREEFDDTVYPQSHRLNALPLSASAAGQLLVRACQTQFACPGYGKEVIFPASYIGKCLARYGALTQEDAMAWRFLQTAGAVVAAAKVGVPILFDRLLELYGLVSGHKAAGGKKLSPAGCNQS